MHFQDQIEIRLLGPTFLRRRGGDVVAPKEWRTAKSLELVRLLALSHGAPVRIEVVLDRLWPDAPTKKAQASLRTATYHVRLALGEDSIERRADGLALHHAWTDVHAYEMLADEIEAARRAGEHMRVATLSREAEALYVHDIETESSGEWLIEAQDHWRQLRLSVLLAASESAVAMGRMREALDLATETLKLERSSERAVRAMMRAFGALGEIEKALSAFERLKEELADQYGVDPAPQTRALHLQLLTGAACAGHDARPDTNAVVGHDEAVGALADALRRMHQPLDGSQGSGVVWLLGRPGSGRGAVVRAAGDRAGLQIGSTRLDLGGVPQQRTPGTPDVLVTPEVPRVTSWDVVNLQSRAAALGTVLIVPTNDMSAGALRTILGRDDYPPTQVVRVGPLGRAAVADLLRLALQGDPTPALVDAVMTCSGGLSGVVCATVEEWLHEGRIMWSPDGMTLDASSDAVPLFPATSRRVMKALGTLDFRAMETFAVTAVIGRPVTSGEVDAVLGSLYAEHPDDAGPMLNLLVDVGLLRATSTGYVMRSDQDRNEIFAWLRPATLRRLHSAVADEVRLEPADRIVHLMSSGQHDLACDLGVKDLLFAGEEGNLEQARQLLELLGRLSTRTSTTQGAAAVERPAKPGLLVVSA